MFYSTYVAKISVKFKKVFTPAPFSLIIFRARNVVKLYTTENIKSDRFCYCNSIEQRAASTFCVAPTFGI